jgi:hypothetical protein
MIYPWTDRSLVEVNSTAHGVGAPAGSLSVLVIEAANIAL